MPAPLTSQEATGKPRGLFVLLLIVGIFGGCIIYAAQQRTPTPTPTKPDAPQVQGTAVDTETPAEEYVPAEDIVEPTAPTTDEPEAAYLITATVDGDTVKASIDGKTETIRLIGVDTPETKDPRKKVQCFGEQAAAYTKTSLLQKRVTLEADESQDNRDKYGRLLRYIILDDGTNFNGSLIKQGYAYEYTYRVPYSYQSLFKAYQAEAAAAQRGLWSPNTCNGLR